MVDEEAPYILVMVLLKRRILQGQMGLDVHQVHLASAAIAAADDDDDDDDDDVSACTSDTLDFQSKVGAAQ